jgi:hypothetical protein
VLKSPWFLLLFFNVCCSKATTKPKSVKMRPASNRALALLYLAIWIQLAASRNLFLVERQEPTPAPTRTSASASAQNSQGAQPPQTSPANTASATFSPVNPSTTLPATLVPTIMNTGPLGNSSLFNCERKDPKLSPLPCIPLTWIEY